MILTKGASVSSHYVISVSHHSESSQ